ncbi:hypothetical protein B296_00046470 [Ensete ventricosum]|uniref:Uncharacterized protein n=1 Tax=Ensete ventricosum TaxID=4639 RepID=A0A426XD59_ENSVE|nr:hypothetical protein B296_00046470 [Ensete ventricosum]
MTSLWPPALHRGGTQPPYSGGGGGGGTWKRASAEFSSCISHINIMDSIPSTAPATTEMPVAIIHVPKRHHLGFPAFYCYQRGVSGAFFLLRPRWRESKCHDKVGDGRILCLSERRVCRTELTMGSHQNDARSSESRSPWD